jgi:O-antigen/teichoic acid export membrane protein
MHIRRIIQLALTSFVSQGVTIISQLLIPPLFLHMYANGVEVYGEWIALSASVNYLGTLNYGIQTYANNQMTILYNRGEVSEAKGVQASALRLLLALVGGIMSLGAVVLFVPVGNWLRLRHVSAAAASLTLYLLISQIVVNMLFGLLTNSFMVVGRLPRGSQWSNAQRLTSIVGTSVALLLRAPLPILALIQLTSLILFLLLVLIDIRRVAPVLLPSLKYGDWKQVLTILKPSGHFGLISIAGFLTWQGPVLLIQRILGPVAVTLFSIVRVVFQMSRQLLSIASAAVSQDITLLVGQRDWRALRRLYDLSERVVLFLVPLVSVGSLLMCPFLFTVWLHKRTLYAPSLCILMAIASAVLGIKEHKTQFQSSSNEHETLSLVSIAGYSIMLIVCLSTVKSFGLPGFMVTWIAWEIIQTGIVLKLNRKLFPAEMGFSIAPILRLSMFMIAAFGLAVWPAYKEANWPLGAGVGFALLATAVLAVAAYFTFGIGEIRGIVEARLRRRFAAES